MKAPFRNLSHWLNRLGVQPATIGLEHQQTVQPVEIVSDSSGLTSPLLPPTAISGCRVSTAAEDVAFEFESVAPGGSLIREMIWSMESNATPAGHGHLAYMLRQPHLASPGLVRPPLKNKYDCSPIPTLGSFRAGPRIGADPWSDFVSVNDPSFTLGQNRVIVLTNIFVPSGMHLLFQDVTIAGTASFHVAFRWEEYPVA